MKISATTSTTVTRTTRKGVKTVSHKVTSVEASMTLEEIKASADPVGLMLALYTGVQVGR